MKEKKGADFTAPFFLPGGPNAMGYRFSGIEKTSFVNDIKSKQYNFGTDFVKKNRIYRINFQKTFAWY